MKTGPTFFLSQSSQSLCHMTESVLYHYYEKGLFPLASCFAKSVTMKFKIQVLLFLYKLNDAVIIATVSACT